MGKEESSVKSEVISGLSKKALIFGIVYVALISLFNYLATYRWVPWWWNSIPGYQYFDAMALFGYLAVLLVFWLFLVTLLNPIFRFKTQELTVIYGMTVIAQLISYSNMGFVNWFAWIGFEFPISHAPGWPLADVVTWVKANSQFAQYLWLDPKYDLYVEGNIGKTVWWTGGPIRWDLFAPLINWRVLVFVSFFFVQAFLFLIVRRRMIQEEMLPFPLASAPGHLIESAAESSKSKMGGIFKQKYLWIGILLGIVMQAGYWYGLINTYKVPYANFRLSTMWIATTDAKISAFFLIAYGVPWVWAIGLLTPVEVSTTFVGVYAVIGLIIPSAVVGMGLFTPSYASGWHNIAQDYFDYGGGWNHALTSDWLTRYGWTPVVFAGYIWLVVWMLYTGRRSFLAGIRSVLSPNSQIDRAEAFPYRWLYIGLLLSLAAHLVAAAMIGAILWLVFVGLVFQAIVWLGYTRVRAEGGGFGTAGCPPGWSHSAYAGALDEITYLTGNLWKSTGGFAYGSWASYATGWLAPMGYVHIGPAVYTGGHQNWFSLPAWYTLELFKVGDLTKTNSRSIFYGLIIALIVSLAVTIPAVMHGLFIVGRAGITLQTGVKGAYWGLVTARIYGLNPAFNAYFVSEGAAGKGNYEGVRMIGGPPDYLYYILIWVAVFAVLTMVRTKYPRFIFNPTGLIMAAMFGLGPSFFVPMLVTLAVKIIATRYIGVKTAAEVLLPIAVGLLVAQGLYYFIDCAVMPIVAGNFRLG